MRSQKQIEASRANGAKSKGPKTPEGKARSSRNSFRHGLLSRCVLLEDESPEHFEALFNQYLLRFDPVDDFEICLIEEMAAAFWRGRRVMAVETRLLDDAIVCQHHPDPLDRLAAGFSSLVNNPEFKNLSRYEAHYDRIFQRALKNLLTLRKEKSARQSQPVDSDPPQVPDLATPPNEPETDPVPTPQVPDSTNPPNEPEPAPSAEVVIGPAVSPNRPNAGPLLPSTGPASAFTRPATSVTPNRGEGHVRGGYERLQVLVI